MRRSLINAANALANEGEVHRTVDEPSMYRVRSAEVLLPSDTDWFEATEPNRRADGGVRIANFVTGGYV